MTSRLCGCSAARLASTRSGSPCDATVPYVRHLRLHLAREQRQFLAGARGALRLVLVDDRGPPFEPARLGHDVGQRQTRRPRGRQAGCRLRGRRRGVAEVERGDDVRDGEDGSGRVLAHDGARRRRHHQRRRDRLAQHALRRRTEEETGGAGLALRAEHDEGGVRVGGGLQDFNVRQPDPDVDRRRPSQCRGRDRRREGGQRLSTLALDHVRIDGHRRGLHEQRLDNVQQRQGGTIIAIGPGASSARGRMADDVR